ncbi:MAG: hypothetical protein H6718_16640 [Polyangiaceae bacterium]|nr:hypothetical protein [Myxococcales bacterium]MCB9587029.1 hypothetical protein [Polyangiaceae bacterium]
MKANTTHSTGPAAQPTAEAAVCAVTWCAAIGGSSLEGSAVSSAYVATSGLIGAEPSVALVVKRDRMDGVSQGSDEELLM